jgi:Glutathione-dependent formaldehyde-activating enzyme
MSTSSATSRGNCHCSNCRASTGSAFKPFVGIERDKLEILEGADTLLVWGTDDANHIRCGICGSLLLGALPPRVRGSPPARSPSGTWCSARPDARHESPSPAAGRSSPPRARRCRSAARCTPGPASPTSGHRARSARTSRVTRGTRPDAVRSISASGTIAVAQSSAIGRPTTSTSRSSGSSSR